MILDQFGRPYAASLENPAMSLDDPDTWDDVLGGVEAESGIRVTPRRVLGYPPIWRGINLIASGCAKLPLVVYKRDGDDARERDRKHAAYRLLRRKPNKWVTAFHFRRTLTYHAIGHGNGYAAIFRDRNGAPEDLLILSPTATYPVQYDGELWYVTEIGGETRRIPARHVLHIRGLSFDGLCGYSVYDVMKEALGLGMAARSYAARFFGEGSNAGGILMVPGSFKEEQVKNLLASWAKMAVGLQKSHKVAVLQDGAKFEKTTINAEESQLIPTQEHEVRMAANILNLPPHKLGDNSKSSYNSLEQENRAYLQDSLDPWLVAWESECDDKLLSDDEQENETHYCEHIRDALERTDARGEIAGLVMELNNGLVNLDEARAIRNRGPVPNGEGKKFRQPANIGTVGEPPPAPPPAAAQATLEILARDKFDRLIKVEVDKATAAGNGRTAATWDRGAWNAWIDRFYDQHRTWMREALAPIVGMACAITGRDQFVAELLDQLVDGHVSASIEQLRQVDAPHVLTDTVSQWPARAQTLLARLKGEPRETAA